MMETISETRSFDGSQGVFRHRSDVCDCDMTFGLYLPPAATAGPVPLLWYLSGLTCTHENAMVKAGAQAWASEAGLAVCFPDTSPRGDTVADDAAYDLGQGAGFYVDATNAPWRSHFRMFSYIADELPALLSGAFPLDMAAQGITGHSMGGHGALTIAMRRPGQFRSVSAFAPICHPTGSDWGQKQFRAYLGSVEKGKSHDATRLVEEEGFGGPILIDTGTDDEFTDKLGTDTFAEAAVARGQEATIRMQKGYDHSYFFVSTFMPDHVAFHAGALGA